MFPTLHSGTIPLDIAKAFIKKHCQKKMLFSKQDVVSIVLVGSEETKNSLNSQNGGYQHIQVCRPVGLLDLEIIETIESADVEVTQQDIERANNDDKPVGDLVDGIVVAMDLLDDFVKARYILYLIPLHDIAIFSLLSTVQLYVFVCTKG